MSTKKVSNEEKGNGVLADVRRSAPIRRVFTLPEKRGGLPYIVMWISLSGIPSILQYSTLKDANQRHEHLKSLGREPALLIDLMQCEFDES